MLVLENIAQAQTTLSQLSTTDRLVLVPTMGCLHEGHLKLVHRAKQLGTRVAVSIFVNPLQFGPHEDFDRYPRTFAEDKTKLEEAGVDFIFHPKAVDLYPEGFACSVQVGPLGDRLCGKFRPGHFNGVATVCMKLFQITRAKVAVFGEKDFQQLQVVRNLVRDFNLPISIEGHPTVRDEDGIALSSRNRFLSAKERELARLIPHTLHAILKLALDNPAIKVSQLLYGAREALAPLEVQYLEITSGNELQSAPPSSLVQALQNPRAFLAVKLGNTRLIDNMSLKEEPL